MTVEQIISDTVFPLKKSDKAAQALEWMDDCGVGQLPVVDGAGYLGLISESILLSADENAKIESLSGNLPKPFIGEGEHYYNAIQMMAEQKLSVLPVLDKNYKYFGVITREDALDQLIHSYAIQNPGGIIILELNQNDYSLGEIARIVESNDTKIISLGIQAVPDSNKMEVTLKLNRINIESVIHAFERFNYEIRSYYGENRKDEELLRERYESLLTWLNI